MLLIQDWTLKLLWKLLTLTSHVSLFVTPILHSNLLISSFRATTKPPNLLLWFIGYSPEKLWFSEVRSVNSKYGTLCQISFSTKTSKLRFSLLKKMKRKKKFKKKRRTGMNKMAKKKTLKLKMVKKMTKIGNDLRDA